MNDAAVNDGVPRKDDLAKILQPAITIPGVIMIRIAQLFADVIKIVVIHSICGMIELLHTQHICILGFKQGHHFKPRLASFVVVAFQFYKACHIPGSYAKCIFFAGIIKVLYIIDCKKNSDAFKTNKERNKRNEHIARTGYEPKKNKDEEK